MVGRLRPAAASGRVVSEQAFAGVEMQGRCEVRKGKCEGGPHGWRHCQHDVFG